MSNLKTRILFITVILIMCACYNTGIKTNVREVDKKYIFSKKEEQDFDSVRLKRYLLNTNNDSAYTIIVEPNSVISRGWSYKFIRIGDWYFETDNKLDSICSYVNYCGGVHHINTVKVFNNNKPNSNKGKWHEFIYDSINSKVDNPFMLKLNIYYDKERYAENFWMYLFRDPIYNADYCDIDSLTKDSLPSYGDDFYELRITPKDKGKNTIQGYYLLKLKEEYTKPENKASFIRVFFRLDFEAK